MFIDLPADEPYADPWHASLSYRLSKLRRGGYRVAYFYEQPDNSTFRYRVFNMIEAIDKGLAGVSASYFHLGDSGSFDEIVSAADVLVICRARYGDGVATLISLARQRGVRVLFDVDDLVFDTQYVHLLTKSLAQSMSTDADWDFWFAYVGRIGATLRQCDGAICTNAYLAERIKEFAKVEVCIVPNFLNDLQLTRSEAIVRAKRASNYARDADLHIGYFSGSPTHKRDFDIAASAIAAILDEFPMVRLRMAGYLEVPEQLSHHSDRIDRLGFTDFVNLQGLIASTEINIAPLQDNRFTNCKSELKYFEAAAVGTVTIASPSYTFKEAIYHRRNSYISNNHEWYSSIKSVVEGIIEFNGEYKTVAENGVEDAQSHFTSANQAKRLSEVLVHR
ncbi:glycosyltransferase [Aureimonas sp. ME7]|uniref:glycosyltransferase n=1 Tax=Aureimonas sp. ME7 TaxID=2744252 RepID=UPI001AED8669|nr:glycosyltransferase [Aureimonas sp. ME7]